MHSFLSTYIEIRLIQVMDATIFAFGTLYFSKCLALFADISTIESIY